MSVRPSDVRKLYKALLRHGARFSDYNFREYSLRRTRDAFRAARAEADPAAINASYYHGLEQLAVLKRQAAISQMFKASPVVIERPAQAP